MKISKIALLILINLFFSNMFTMLVEKETFDIKPQTIDTKSGQPIKTQPEKPESPQQIEEKEEIIVEITGLTDIKNIGDKQIIISIHGVGEAKAGGWFFEWGNPKIPNCDAIKFNWRQGKITKGMRDKDIINAAEKLASLILDILRDVRSREIRENKKIPLKLILIAHSMGGNVTKCALNFLDHKFKKIQKSEKPETIIGKIKQIVAGIIGSGSQSSDSDYVDERFAKNKNLFKSISDKMTRKYFEEASNRIAERMLLMIPAGSIPPFPFITRVYTLGTPGRGNNFPFNENMNVTKEFICIFSYGDKIQKNAGLSRIPEGENKINIRAIVIKEGKESDPNHDQLVRGTSIVYRLLDINPKDIEDKFTKKSKEENKTVADLKKSTQTITITFPEETSGTLKYEFDTTRPPKETFTQKTVGAIKLKF
ncbi:MAG: hypothetical protein ABIA74_05265 [bacterium]